VDISFAGLKIVVDCANGAAYEAAPALLRRLGATVMVTNNLPDGVNINKDCGSTHLDGLRKAVVDFGADLGIGHDGDADRCLAVDEKGAVVDGDQIMVICARELLGRGALPDKALVATVMSNLGLHQAIKKAGGQVIVTPVGDRYVLEAMLKHGFVLGGEQSGHIIFGEHSTTGDGLLTALQLIAARVRTGAKLSELAGLMTHFPQVLVNVRVKSKEGWQENAVIAAAIREAEAALGEDGRLLVRASGTEPLIRVMAEGPCKAALEELVDKVAGIIARELES
jgi:phosphoglucosamine mutase